MGCDVVRAIRGHRRGHQMREKEEGISGVVFIGPGSLDLTRVRRKRCRCGEGERERQRDLKIESPPIFRGAACKKWGGDCRKGKEWGSGRRGHWVRLLPSISPAGGEILIRQVVHLLVSEERERGMGSAGPRPRVSERRRRARVGRQGGPRPMTEGKR